VPLGIINGFLPGLVLTIFNIVLPMILYKLSKMQGIEALSWLQASVIRKFSIFQIVNNFFFTTASTAILAQLTSIVNDPTSIVNILGQTIPTTATFFITYLLFTTLAVYPMALLNPGGLIVGRLKKKFLVKTPRDLIAVEAAPPRDYGTSYPITLFTFIIAITFSVIASISLPFATLYFAFGWFVNKYNGLYVYNTHFETGGQLWPTVFQMMTWCVFVGQAVFTALLGIKKATGPAIVSAPLRHRAVGVLLRHPPRLQAHDGSAAREDGGAGRRRAREEAGEAGEGSALDRLPRRVECTARLQL